MRKRGLVTLGLLALVLAGGYLVLWLTAPGDRVTPENVARLREGMTRAEVEAALGGPPGVYHPDGERLAALFRHPATGWEWRAAADGEADGAVWAGRAGAVVIGFDRDGRVADLPALSWVDNGHPPLSFLAKLRRYLGMTP